jgi:hypothetical protein
LPSAVLSFTAVWEQSQHAESARSPINELVALACPDWNEGQGGWRPMRLAGTDSPAENLKIHSI